MPDQTGGDSSPGTGWLEQAREGSRATAGAFCPPAEHGLRGEIAVPGDKSISHRAVLMGAVSGGPVRIEGFLPSADTLASVAAVRSLGVAVDEWAPDRLLVHGVGWEGLREPDDIIDVGNAGTLMRLLPGLLAPCDLFAVLTGDSSIRRRPMGRVVAPLAQMGLAVSGRDGGRLPPIAFRGGALRGIEHHMQVASAQVKSCLLIAGLRAEGETVVVEPGPTRDHTERLIRLGGGEVVREGPLNQGGRVRVTPRAQPLTLSRIDVPGDLSSAAFLLVAALLLPGSRLSVRDVGFNPTRTGILDALGAMGARLTVEPQGASPADRSGMTEPGEGVGEPRCRITAEWSELSAIDLGGADVALMIDEVPIWALAAARAQGISRLRGAAELRVKESDRLAAVAALLRVLDVTVVEYDDGLDIEGRPDGWKGGEVRTQGDHRLAMMGAVAGLVSNAGVGIDDRSCIDVSFPGFDAVIGTLAGGGDA